MDIILLIWNIKNCNSNLAAHLHCKPPFCSQNPFMRPWWEHAVCSVWHQWGTASHNRIGLFSWAILWTNKTSTDNL